MDRLDDVAALLANRGRQGGGAAVQDGRRGAAMSGMLFKLLAVDGSAVNGGTGAWPLPQQTADGSWTPGDWIEVKGRLKRCVNGLHLTTLQGVLNYKGSAIFEAEYDPKYDPNKHGYEWVVRRARLLRRLTLLNGKPMVRFGVECLDQVAPVYAAARAGDDRILLVLAAARLWLEDKASPADLDRAWDAACGALNLVSGAAQEVADAAKRLISEIEERPEAWSQNVFQTSARAVMGIRERAAFEAWQKERLFDYLEGRVS